MQEDDPRRAGGATTIDFSEESVVERLNDLTGGTPLATAGDNQDPNWSPDGLRIAFQQTQLACYAFDPAYLTVDTPIEIRGTCYASAPAAGRWVTPGATYELTVRTTRGEEARGRTVVPGDFALRGLPESRENDTPPVACILPPETPLPLTWSRSEGAWGYIAPLRISGLREVLPPSYNAPDPLELVGVSVSSSDTSLVLPGEFGVFDRFSYNQDLLRLLQAGLPAGTFARVVVAAADRTVRPVRGKVSPRRCACSYDSSTAVCEPRSWNRFWP